MFDDQWLNEGTAARRENFENWNLVPDGVLISFEDYQVGAHSFGQPELIVPYSRLQKSVRRPYFATATAQIKNEPREIWIGDVLSDDARISYRDYILQRKNRTIVDPEIALKPIDVSYAVLNRRRERLMKFDANVYFGLGNATRFGLISILGNQTKQAIISQDVYRGGRGLYCRTLSTASSYLRWARLVSWPRGRRFGPCRF